MLRSVFLVLVAVIRVSTAKNSTCEPFRNVKAIIFTGAPNDPQVITVQSKADLVEAYRVEIDGQNVGELCENAFEGLANLDTLTIRSSHLKQLKAGAFRGAINLRTLDLSENEIANVAAGVFSHLPVVRRINLTANSIEEIDSGAFDDLPRLQVLELAENRVGKFDNRWFSGSPQVYRIVLDGNRLRSIPKDALKSLVKGETKPRAFHLWLSRNSIEDIHPLAFRGVKEIESLWLDDNKIGSLNAEVFEHVAIDRLTLDGNDLKCLNDAFFDKLHVKELNVDRNPLDCDCLREMRKLAQKKSIEFMATRRGLMCLRAKVESALNTQKQFYENQLEIEQRF